MQINCMRLTRTQLLTVLYFMVAFVEVVAEMFAYKPVIIVAKPLITVVLIVLYLQASATRNGVFVVAMVFSLITNLFFIPNTNQALFYGIIAFLMHRVLIIYIIISLVKIRDFIPTFIATIPFLLVFFYLFFITDEIPENSFLIIVISNLLISVLGGIAVANYIMKDTKSSALLLLVGLLLVLLQLVVFVERYYLSHMSPIILRPISMSFHVCAFYALCQYMIVAEREQLNNNGAAIAD